MNPVYLGKPRKQMTEDGLRLGRHLRNRGRPAHSTWTKYKQQIKGKRQESFDGMLFFTDLYFLFIFFNVKKTVKLPHSVYVGEDVLCLILNGVTFKQDVTKIFYCK